VPSEADCFENGQASLSVASDGLLPCSSATEWPSLNHAHKFFPQVGRFLYTPNFSGIESQASASDGPDPSLLMSVRGVR